jgi:hypothetical protein
VEATGEQRQQSMADEQRVDAREQGVAAREPHAADLEMRQPIPADARDAQPRAWHRRESAEDRINEAGGDRRLLQRDVRRDEQREQPRRDAEQPEDPPGPGRTPPPRERIRGSRGGTPHHEDGPLVRATSPRAEVMPSASIAVARSQ